MRRLKALAILLVACGLLAAFAPPAAALPGWSIIVNVHSSKCLNADINSNHVIQWTCNTNAENMNWSLVYVYDGNNDYELQVDTGGVGASCAGVQGGSTADGAYIVTMSCDAIGRMLYHQIKVNDASGGEYEFKNVNSGDCLNVQQKSVNNGADIIQWPCNGDGNELWWIR